MASKGFCLVWISSLTSHVAAVVVGAGAGARGGIYENKVR